MNRKLMSLTLAVALAVTMLMGVCASAEAKPFEGVTITFWGGQTELNPGTLAVIAAAEEVLACTSRPRSTPADRRATTSSRPASPPTTCRTSWSTTPAPSCMA